MFSKLAIIVTTLFAALAAAAPAPWGETPAHGQCAVGDQTCCDSVQSADSPEAAQLIASLGLQVAADILVGLHCSPIGAAVLTSSSCSQQPTCCNRDQFGAIVAVGCNPLNVGA